MRKGFALPLILVILVVSVSVIAGGYYLLKPKPTTHPTLETTIQQDSTPTPETSTSPASVDVGRLNWKTYESPIFKFTLKLPADWVTREDSTAFSFSHSQPGFGVSAVHITNYASPFNENLDEIETYDQIESATSNADVSKLIKDIPAGSTVIKTGNLSISGKPATKVVASSINTETILSYYSEFVYVKNGSKIWTIGTLGRSKNLVDSNRNTVDQVLSTFKFLE